MWGWNRKAVADARERVVLLEEWPQPAVVAEPRVVSDDTALSLLYRSCDDKFAVVRFSPCTYFAFGAPNDEAMGGHPLAHRGLQFYSVHEVLDSSLIRELARRNSVHPRHSASLFANKKHYLITFQDSTLECVVSAEPSAENGFMIFDRRADVEESWSAGFVA
jgi:hypothetical protein